MFMTFPGAMPMIVIILLLLHERQQCSIGRQLRLLSNHAAIVTPTVTENTLYTASGSGVPTDTIYVYNAGMLRMRSDPYE